MNRDEIGKLKSEVMTLEYQSGLWVTAEDYLDALARLEDAEAAAALVVEQAAGVCDDLAIGYAKHKGVPGALSDASGEIRALASPSGVEALAALRAERREGAEMTDPEWKFMTDWSGLPDVYVTKAECQQGMFWRIEACSVPMAIGPEVRLIRAERDGFKSREMEWAAIRDEVVAERDDLRARLAAAEGRVAGLREALKPFKDMAGELFARNWNRSDVVIALDNPGEPHRLTFGDFLELHAALAAVTPPADTTEGQT